MRHETMSGGVLELGDPAPAVVAFLARVQEAAADPEVGIGVFTALAYGVENPTMDVTTVPGRAVVTADVFASPVYHAIADLLVRKQIQQDTVRFSMTVQAAATRLGITDGAVRQLISRRVLASRRPTPTSAHRLSSADVEAYAVVREQREPVRAPRDTTLPPPPVSAALEARVGSHPGASFRITGAQVAGQKISTWREGTIPAGWTQIAILAAKGSKGARCWVLEPADSANAVDFEGFYVHGPFKVTETINNERAARERFERFQPKTTED